MLDRWNEKDRDAWETPNNTRKQMSQCCGEKSNRKQMGGGVCLAPIPSAKPFSELKEAVEEGNFVWGGVRMGHGEHTNHEKKHCLFCRERKILVNIKIKEMSRKQNYFMLDTMTH